MDIRSLAEPTAIGPAGQSGVSRPVRPDDEYVSWSLVAGIVRRRWLTIAVVLLAAIGLAVIYLVTTPAVYESSASILVEQDEYNLPELVKRQFTDNELGTQMEMIKNGGLAAKVVRELSLRATVGSPDDVPRSRLFTGLSVADSAPPTAIELDRIGATHFAAVDRTSGARVDSIAIGEPVRLAGVGFALLPAALEHRSIRLDVATLQSAVRDLEASIKVVRPDRNGNVIAITHRDLDPELAGRIPDLLASDHVAQRVEWARAKVRDAVEFLGQQSDSLRQELVGAEEALNRFRRRNGIVSLSSEAMSQVTQSGELRATRARLDAERTALQRLVDEADSSAGSGASSYRRLTAFPTLIDNPVVSNLLTTLNTLENERAELLIRRTPADPDAVASAHRIAEVDSQLRNLTLTYLAGLGNQVAALDRALAGYAATGATMPGKSMLDERLSRRPRVLSDVYALVQTRLQEARLAEGAVKPGVSVVDRAEVPELPVWPRTGVILAVAMAVGLIGGGAAAWAREAKDDSVHSRADVIRATDARVLGVVPHIRKLQRAPAERGRAPTLWQSPTGLTRSDLSAMEAYNWLDTTLILSQSDGAIGTIAFTSPLAREGKTLSAANFALSGCRRGRRILLIDADLRRGRVHDVFGTRRTPGLAEVLATGLDPSEAILRIPAGAGATIDVMPAGDCVDHPAALLGSAGMRDLLASLRGRYDLVVNDTPPVNLVSDSLLLAQFVQAIVLVARAGVTEAQSLAEATRHLREAGAPLLGVLLNDIDLQRDGTYDDGYRYLKQAGDYAVATNP